MPASTDYDAWARFVQTVDDSSDDDDGAGDSSEEEAEPAPPSAPAGPKDAASVVDRLTQVERLGEEVMTERQQMVELDRRRNSNREALGAIRRAEKAQGAAAAAEEKRWMCLGEVFVRQPTSRAKEMLQADQQRIEEEMRELRAKIKRKSSKLCELDPSIAGGSDIHRSFVSLHGVSARELEREMGRVEGTVVMGT